MTRIPGTKAAIILAVLLCIACVMPAANAAVIPMPQGIEGVVVSQTGEQIKANISVFNTANKFLIITPTGVGESPGKFMIAIKGQENNTIVVNVYNDDYSTEMIMGLKGVTRGISFILGPRPEVLVEGEPYEYHRSKAEPEGGEAPPETAGTTGENAPNEGALPSNPEESPYGKNTPITGMFSALFRGGGKDLLSRSAYKLLIGIAIFGGVLGALIYFDKRR